MAGDLHPTWQGWASLGSNPQVWRELKPLLWVFEPLLPWDGSANQNTRRWCSITFCWVYSNFSHSLVMPQQNFPGLFTMGSFCMSKMFVTFSHRGRYSSSTPAKYCLCNNQKLCYSFIIFPVKASLALHPLLDCSDASCWAAQRLLQIWEVLSVNQV